MVLSCFGGCGWRGGATVKNKRNPIYLYLNYISVTFRKTMSLADQK